VLGGHPSAWVTERRQAGAVTCRQLRSLTPLTLRFSDFDQRLCRPDGCFAPI